MNNQRVRVGLVGGGREGGGRVIVDGYFSFVFFFHLFVFVLFFTNNLGVSKKRIKKQNK